MTAGSTPAAPAMLRQVQYGPKAKSNDYLQGERKNMADIKKFVAEVKTELKKVSWSTREDLITSTIVVLSSVAFLAIFIGICDFILSRVINLIMR